MGKKSSLLGPPNPITGEDEKIIESEREQAKYCMEIILNSGIFEKFSPHILFNVFSILMLESAFQVPLHPDHFKKINDLRNKKYKSCWKDGP